MSHELPSIPLYPLALQHLRHPKSCLAPNVPTAQLHRAVATNACGLDHLEGEAFLALLDDSTNRDGTHAAMVSERRLFRRAPLGLVSEPYEIPFAAVTAVQTETRMLGTRLKLLAGGHALSYPPACFDRALLDFFDALTRVPPAYRVVPPRPQLAPSPHDPTGASALASTMPQSDPRVIVLLRLVYEGHRRGWLTPELGADLAQRVNVLARTLRYGRGARQGYWLSGLDATDLARVLRGVLGTPTTQGVQNGALVMDFVLGQRGSNAGAVASSVVGLAMLAVVGVGWVSVPRETLRGLRAVVAAQGPASGFLLMADVNGKMDGLAVHKPQLFEKLSMDLANLEALVLLLRCAFGWNASVDELLGLARPAIEQRVYELLGPTDLMLFFALLRGR